MKTNALSPGTQVPLSLALLGISGASHTPCSLWELVTEPSAPWDSVAQGTLGWSGERGLWEGGGRERPAFKYREETGLEGAGRGQNGRVRENF